MADRKALILVVIQFVLAGVLLAAFLIFPMIHSPILRALGYGLIIAGLLLIYLAIRTHGQTNNSLPNVAPTPHDTAQLVHTGIYAQIRHPIYSGVLLASLGAALVHGHVVGLAIWAVLVAFFTYKSMYEERLLQQRYPDYVDYKKYTGRFAPLWVRLQKG